MNDQDFKKTIRRVKKSVERWLSPCGLRMWRRIHISYHRDTAVMALESDTTLNESQRHVVGRAIVDWDYREATVHFNIGKMYYMTDEDIDYTVRHEFCHVIVNEMRQWQHYDKGVDLCMPHEERVVSELALVLDWIRVAGWNEAKASLKKKKKR